VQTVRKLGERRFPTRDPRVEFLGRHRAKIRLGQIPAYLGFIHRAWPHKSQQCDKTVIGAGPGRSQFFGRQAAAHTAQDEYDDDRIVCIPENGNEVRNEIDRDSEIDK
jgi:hypothetical protein